MTTLEQEIIERISKLDSENQRRVLDFVTQLEAEPPLSARDLLKLPYKERQRRVKAAFDAPANEEFETFEAYSEEFIDE